MPTRVGARSQTSKISGGRCTWVGGWWKPGRFLGIEEDTTRRSLGICNAHSDDKLLTSHTSAPTRMSIVFSADFLTYWWIMEDLGRRTRHPDSSVEQRSPSLCSEAPGSISYLMKGAFRRGFRSQRF